MTDSTLTPEDVSPSNQEGLPLGNLRSLLGFHVRLAHVAIYRDFGKAMTVLDLTQTQSAVLELISASPGVSQVDLAATLGTDRATMMAIVDRLQARDFVVRRRSREDRRRQELYLTDTGASTVVILRQAITKHERHFTERFSAAELEGLIDSLRRIHRQF